MALFPNSIGLGGQELGMAMDPIVKRMCVEIYNDAAAELQASSNMRFLPMPVLYPAPLDAIAGTLSTLRESTRRRVLGENAAKLYRL